MAKMTFTRRKVLTATACLCVVPIVVALGWLLLGGNSKVRWVGWQRSHIRLTGDHLPMSVTYDDSDKVELCPYYQFGPMVLLRGPSMQSLDRLTTELDIAGLYNSGVRAMQS